VELTRIAGPIRLDTAADDDDPPPCGTGDCPTAFLTDRGTVAIQGYTVDHTTPTGEAVVEIPVALLRETLRALDR
jgi:hypothetical protein